jgi:hypothetical protein
LLLTLILLAIIVAVSSMLMRRRQSNPVPDSQPRADRILIRFFVALGAIQTAVSAEHAANGGWRAGATAAFCVTAVIWVGFVAVVWWVQHHWPLDAPPKKHPGDPDVGESDDRHQH